MSKKGREARERSFQQRALEKGIVARLERALLPPEISFTLFASFLPSPFPTPGRRKKREREGTPMNFRFTNLLGAPYRGGTILLSKGDSLLAPVGNRVNEVRSCRGWRVECERVHVEPPERRTLQRP
jgi:hypothetical protein